MRSTRTRTLVALTLLTFSYSIFSTPVFAQANPESEQLRSLAGCGERALRDLNDRGIALHSTMIYDWSKEFEPEEPQAGFGRYSFDITVPIDGKKLFGLSGSDAMLRVRHHLNNFGEDDMGENQLFSNIDAAPRTMLYEAWIEQRLFSEKVRLKFGKIDANTEFAAVQTAGDFLNSSMGFSPTIIAFPTYPEPKLGFNAFFRPSPNDIIGFGVFQTATAGVLTIAEPARSWNLGQKEAAGRVSLGYWHLGGSLGRFDGKIAAGTSGVYSVLEQTLWHSHHPDGHDRRTSAFFQFGTADGRISPYQYHFGSGAVLEGVVHKRSQDFVGVAATWVRLSSQPAAHFEYPSELILELYYKAVISSHIAIVQDFQYLHHPGGLKQHPDCPVLTPRVVITF